MIKFQFKLKPTEQRIKSKGLNGGGKGGNDNNIKLFIYKSIYNIPYN